MASVILATMLLNGSGKDEAKPALVCAEGSLISLSKFFLPELENCLQEVAADCGRHAVIRVGHDTTLPGSAVAALMV